MNEIKNNYFKDAPIVGNFSLEAIADTAPGAVFCINPEPDMEVLYANKHFYRMFQITETTFKVEHGNRLSKLIHAEDYKDFYKTVQDIGGEQKYVNMKIRIVTPDGETHWLSINASGGKTCVCVAVDETESINILLESETFRREIEAIANSTPGCISKIIYKDGNFKYVFLSNGLHYAAGYTRDDDVFNSLEGIIVPEDFAQMIKSIEEQLDYSGFTTVFRIIKKDGSYSWVRQNGSLIEVTENGEYVFVCVYIDIDNIKELQIETEKEKERLKILLDSSGDILFEYSILNDTMRFIDRKMLDVGKSDDWYVYNYINKIISDNTVHPGDSDLFLSVLTGNEKEDINVRIKNSRHPGDYNWYIMKSVVMYGSDGSPDQVVGVLRDIEQQKSAELELMRSGKLDSQTLLFNREAVEIEINALLVNQKDGANNALALIDIDRFDTISNQIGFTYGNGLIKDLVQLINDAFPPESIAGRLGTDSFAALIPNIPNEDFVVKTMRGLCETFATEHRGTKNKGNATLSVGISYTPIDGRDFTKLHDAALGALRRAKSNGGNGIASYSTDMSGEAINTLYESDGTHGLNTFSLTPNRTIITVLDMLLSESDVSGAISTVLEIIGKRFRINRILIYENVHGGNELLLTYEWSLNGLSCPVKSVSYKNTDGGLISSVLAKRGLGIYDDIGVFSELGAVYDDMSVRSISKVMQLITGKDTDVENWIRFDLGDRNILTGNDAKQITNLMYLLSVYISKDRKQDIVSSDNFFAQLITRQVGLFVYVIDVKTYTIVNIFRGIKNYRKEAKVGQLCYRAVRGLDSPCEDCPLGYLSETKRHSTTMVLDDETKMQVNVTVSRLKTPEEYYAVVSYYDTSQNTATVTDIENQASMPVFNRFRNEAKTLLKNNFDDRFRVIYIELTSLNEICETYGFVVGNKLISAIERVSERLAGKDSCYGHISAGKFVMLQRLVQHVTVIRSIGAFLSEFKTEVADLMRDILNPAYIVFVSGVYEIKSNNEDITEAVDKAHLARKHITSDSMGQFYVYDSSIAEKEMRNRLFKVSMERALKNSEFKVFLQPKFSLKTDKLTGAEALVRWITPSNVTLYPGEFIPYFEQNGFITKLDFYVYEQVFKLISSWIRVGKQVIPVSINVSGAHIDSLDFVERVIGLVEKYNVPPEYVELEIKEKVFIKHKEKSHSIIKRLASIGFKIAIDDYGTGLSSLSVLYDGDVKIVKIDKQFFEKAVEEGDHKMLQGLITYLRFVDIKVVCEGIETTEQLDFLKSIECDEAYGYLFAKPLPLDLFDKMYMFNISK